MQKGKASIDQNTDLIEYQSYLLGGVKTDASQLSIQKDRELVGLSNINDGV